MVWFQIFQILCLYYCDYEKVQSVQQWLHQKNLVSLKDIPKYQNLFFFTYKYYTVKNSLQIHSSQNRCLFTITRVLLNNKPVLEYCKNWKEKITIIFDTYILRLFSKEYVILFTVYDSRHFVKSCTCVKVNLKQNPKSTLNQLTN